VTPDRDGSARRIIVTGGARGIGAAVVEAIVADGRDVVLADIDAEAGNALAEELASDGRVHVVAVDVTDTASVTQLVGRAEELMGGVDGLVNSAGGFPRVRLAEELNDDEWRRVVDLNLFGTFACCRAIIPALRRAGFGRIVNVTSEAGRMPGWTTGVHYVAAKAGVLGMTRLLARELGPDGITVNATAPGTTMTDRMVGLYSENELEKLVNQIPLRRPAEPADQADAIMFLLSNASRYVTGATLDVNGGRVTV
jgi:NAD(P)-dependent dehydrogenase (short-subunit alcohol dehydrogenase family)